MDFIILFPFFLLIPAVLILGVTVVRNRSKGKALALIVTLALALLWTRFTYQVLVLNESLAGAAHEGNKAEVIRLLNAGANPESTLDGATALELAREAGHIEIEQILRRAGARR